MPIAYVSAATEVADSITSMPSHTADDVLVIIALGASAPSVPVGWESTETGTNYAVGWKRAASGSETSGTWTNGAILFCHVYRGASGVGDVTRGGGTSGTLTYPALTLQRGDSTSWAMRAGYAEADGTPAVATPTGFTSRTDETSIGTYAYRSSDTNGTTSSVTTSAHSIGITSSWQAVSAEILAERDGTLFWSFP